jgi:N-acetylglutamate synthase-like GNAT family acetyltransferase
MNDPNDLDPLPALAVTRWTFQSQHGFEIDTSRERLDLAAIYDFLSQSYWARGISRARLARALEQSLPFGAYDAQRFVGFARVVSDRATFAYLSDVFVLPSERGRGVSKALVAAVLAHPELQGLRRWMLGTRDAHELYRKFGFTQLAKPEIMMEIWEPTVYDRLAAEGRR